jgi:dynein heavy chain 1
LIRWTEQLNASTQTPAWLGLPENAEVLLLTTKGKSLVQKLLKLQTLQVDAKVSDPFEEEEMGK